MRINRLISKVFVALLVFVGLGLSYIPIAEAAAPNPSLGAATVDGNPGEWDLINDFFADMYRAGDPTKKVESKLYLRYDCATNTMYALVLTVTGVPALVEPDNAWIAINGASNKVVHGNSGDDGTPPDFAWVDTQGWEGSFSLPQGSYKILAHVQVFDDGGSQTSATDRKTDKDGIALVISCAPPAGQGAIVINLDTVPNDAQDFTYSNNIPGCSPSFSLDDDAGAPGADATLSNTKTCTPVSPGSYTVTQGLPVSGFLLTSLVCVDPDNGSSTNLATGTVTIDLDAEETVICTYTNTKNDPVVEAFKEASLFNDKNGNGKVNPGDIVLYTVTISNNGGTAATNVTYNDTVDTKTILICSAPDAPTTSLGTISSCTPGSGGSLTVNIGSMATGGSVTIKYKVEVTTGNFNKVSNQGKATGTNFAEEKTDDPVTAATKDPTVVFVSDPSGFIYDENTAQIIAGGKISVTGPGAVTIVHDGSAGFYEWFPNAPVVPGVYTITLTLPPNYSLSTTCLPKDPPPFDPTGGPDPTVLGNGEDLTNPGFLTSNACTDYYFTFDLAPGDPAIQNNNFPLKKSAPPPLVGGDPPIWGDILVFPTPEWALGRDLNGDGDTLDTVLRYKNLRTGELVNTGIPVSGMLRSVDIYEDTIVFVLQESSLLDFLGGAFNFLTSSLGTGPIGTYNLRTGKVHMIGTWGSRPTVYKNFISISGNTVRYYDLNTGRSIDTGIPGKNQALWGRKIAYQHTEIPNGPLLIYIYDIDTGAILNTHEPGSSPAIYENRIAFTTEEPWVAQDLNGDGDQSDTVIRYYDLSSQMAFNTGEEGRDPAVYGKRIVFENESRVRYFDIESGHAFDTGKLGYEPDIYEGTITYFVWERLKGADLNRDGDKSDPIVETHQISESDRMLPRKTATTLSAAMTLSITRVLSTRQANAIRFEVQGVGVASIQVEIYDLQGKRVFESASAQGTALTWNLTTQDGLRVANGVYLYVVKARGAEGKVVQSRIAKLVVLR